MKFALSLLVLLASSQTYAASACLTVAEQKELGSILIEQDAAIKERPDCVKFWGAAGCLSPLDEVMKRNFEDRLKACAQEANKPADAPTGR